MLSSTEELAAMAAPAPPPPARRQARWQVRLLGAVAATCSDSASGETLSHWPTRATAALLARLALQPERDHPREELVELLWPGVALAVGRNRLRQALSALRSLLEPRGGPADPVIQADRGHIRVRPGALDCDVRHFEAGLLAGDHAAARQCYRGDFMPGWYDDWVVDERHRLVALHERLQAALASLPGPSGPHSVAGSAATGPVPAGAVAAPPSGLPAYWTRAFGVEPMAARLQALVGKQRLVTLHGPGGSGKTRLAVAVAGALHEDSRRAPGAGGQAAFERIVFVPLAACLDTAQALDALCLALQAEALGDPLARIVAALAGRRTLLVLDNVEQLDGGFAAAMAGVLAATTLLHVLSTSRRLLEVDGEQAFELEGLSLPAAEATPAQASANPAVALFLDRARAVKADFSPGARDLGQVVRLVRLLGGMPLAIELAASRMRSHTPRELLQHLSAGAGTPMLDLLARGSASPDARHASMRHVVAWSWRQLRPQQAELLQVLAVCGGALRPAAAAAVLGLPQQQAARLLDELQDASLLRATEDADGGMRFTLLQPVREYAAEACDADAARQARTRLRSWLIGAAPALLARGTAAVAAEVPQVHAALLTAAADGQPRQALALAVALRGHWDTDQLPYSVLLALETALETALTASAAPEAVGSVLPEPAPAQRTADPALRCEAHELLAQARGVAGCPHEAIAHAQAAVALAQDDRRRSLALARLAWAHYVAGQFEHPLEPLLDEALALAQRCTDRHAQATVLRMQSIVACNIRLDFVQSERLSAATQALWEGLGNQPMAWLSLINRAMMWGKTGRGNADAVAVLGECERAMRAAGDWAGLITCTRQLGRIHIRMRQWQPAACALRRSAQAAWQRHAAQGLAHALLHLPLAMAMEGRTEDAARLDGYAVANWWRLFNGINRIEARELRRTRLLLRLALGSARAEALRIAGRSLDPAAAMALALHDA